MHVSIFIAVSLLCTLAVGVTAGVMGSTLLGAFGRAMLALLLFQIGYAVLLILKGLRSEQRQPKGRP